MIVEFLIAYPVLVAAATMIAWAVVESSIFEPFREWWWSRYPVGDYYYENPTLDEPNPRPTVEDEATLRGGKVKVQFQGYDGYDQTWHSLSHFKLGELVACKYCFSFWTSLLTVALWFPTIAFSWTTLVVALLFPWAVHFGVTVLFSKADDWGIHI